MLSLLAKHLDLPRIAHGFFGRTGGVSDGIYASLNCGPGSGDGQDHVAENRRRVREALGADGLNTLYQVHSPNVAIVTGPWDGAPPQADAMVTAVPGLAIGILTADCAPVLLADADARVVGAAHAGWKGAIGGVIENTLTRMESLGARRGRVAAAIGPCISQDNYEVGPEFIVRFVTDDPANARFFAPGARADHHMFDLEGYVVDRLRAASVDRIETLGACTYARDADFFSFRRTTHRGEKDYGRQISTIVLR
ncbi:MAG: peptidoglycan editing factor PgeF [Alphaproteobacteria bacterium]|nr:peptidoglycan editing factor PgeF [Alphaproteobacteria bacterium]MBL6938636.1 peptidoglycan editing factor PgeF [Alphaproteobacteria bacterium]MBL7098007.1 peptidoglycan editing factor PgeF [Alphaproteobacteria bacterium]